MEGEGRGRPHAVGGLLLDVRVEGAEEERAEDLVVVIIDAVILSGPIFLLLPLEVSSVVLFYRVGRDACREIDGWMDRRRARETSRESSKLAQMCRGRETG